MVDQELRDTLNDISSFIQIKDGESFEAVYVGVKKVISTFTPVDKEGNPNYVTELNFEFPNGVKSLTSVSLTKEMLNAGVGKGEKVKVSRLVTKGTKVTWKVEKVVVAA